MNSIDSRYLAHYERWLWDERNVVLVTGEAAPILRGRAAYHRELDIPLPLSPDVERAVGRMLAAAGLAAVLLARRESWGWTLTLAGQPVGLFCGIEPDGRLCAVVRDADPKRATAVLQRQRQGGPLVQSHISVTHADPVSVVEHYYEQVVQTPTRLIVDEGGRALLVQALPDGSLGELASAAGDTLFDLVDAAKKRGVLQRLDEVLLFYACRCSEELVLDTLLSLPADQRRELWSDDPVIEVECPRCARRYHIRRADN